MTGARKGAKLLVVFSIFLSAVTIWRANSGKSYITLHTSAIAQNQHQSGTLHLERDSKTVRQAKVIIKPSNHADTSTSSTTTASVWKEIVMPARLPGLIVMREFKTCEYSNCVYRFTDSIEEMHNADVVVIEFRSPLLSNVGLLDILPQQATLIVFGIESPGYPHNAWKSIINSFNASMTYTPSSTIYFPYGEVTATPASKPNQPSLMVNFAEGKTKGGFAYVSNCHSMNYDRLEVMKSLSKYVNVDIYGKCTNHTPCKTQADVECEASVHSQYRFYFAFENSLCKDYISIKFWRTLRSSAYFLPVVIGGLSIEDYNKISPPNSFIHADNFSSIKQLGEYLHHLTNDDAAFNRYHQWRERYEISYYRKNVTCDLCELGHNPNKVKTEQDIKLADEWNNQPSCRNYKLS